MSLHRVQATPERADLERPVLTGDRLLLMAVEKVAGDDRCARHRIAVEEDPADEGGAGGRRVLASRVDPGLFGFWLCDRRRGCVGWRACHAHARAQPRRDRGSRKYRGRARRPPSEWVRWPHLCRRHDLVPVPGQPGAEAVPVSLQKSLDLGRAEPREVEDETMAGLAVALSAGSLHRL